MSHVERNDGLKDDNKLALGRYKFAIRCLDGRHCDTTDIGCGMGYGSHLLRIAGHSVIGVDNSQEAIDYARATYGGCYLLRDAEAYIPSADVLICLEALCHLKDPKKFIDNIKSEELIISAPIDPSPNDGYHYRKHNLSEKDFRDLLKGWVIIDEMWQGKKQKYLAIYCKKI